MDTKTAVYVYIAVSYVGGIYYYSTNEKFGNPKWTATGDPNLYKMMIEIGLAPLTLPAFLVIPILSDDTQQSIIKMLNGSASSSTSDPASNPPASNPPSNRIPSLSPGTPWDIPPATTMPIPGPSWTNPNSRATWIDRAIENTNFPMPSNPPASNPPASNPPATNFPMPGDPAYIAPPAKEIVVIGDDGRSSSVGEKTVVDGNGNGSKTGNVSEGEMRRVDDPKPPPLPGFQNPFALPGMPGFDSMIPPYLRTHG